MDAFAVHRLLVGICAAPVAACVVLPYLLGVPPRTAREWAYLVATVTVILWLLTGFVFLRADGRGSDRRAVIATRCCLRCRGCAGGMVAVTGQDGDTVDEQQPPRRALHNVTRS